MCIRDSIDAMSATIETVDWSVLQKITERILAEVDNVNRVCYDMKMCIRDRSSVKVTLQVPRTALS